MEELYNKIGIIINNIIPEEWNKVYLYAEVSEEHQNVFFYYYPKDNQNPIYSMDITDQFNIDDNKFKELRYDLPDCFDELWEEFRIQKQEQWTNLTFILDNTGEFKINYEYEYPSTFGPYAKQVIWAYNTLGIRVGGEMAEDILRTYLHKDNK